MSAFPPFPDHAGQRRAHVLIVEDEVGTASLVRAIVLGHGHGCSATIVSDGLRAMHYMDGTPPYHDREIYPVPDLIILDLGLPGISGLEVLGWMATNAHLAESPVVVFSGTADPDAARQAYALGARAYLPKSADPTKLAEIVRDILARWAPQARYGTEG